MKYTTATQALTSNHRNIENMEPSLTGILSAYLA